MRHPVGPTRLPDRFSSGLPARETKRITGHSGPLKVARHDRHRTETKSGVPGIIPGLIGRFPAG
jgi:hypothetical protein